MEESDAVRGQKLRVKRFARLQIGDEEYREGEYAAYRKEGMHLPQWCKIEAMVAKDAEAAVCLAVRDLQGSLQDSPSAFDVPGAAYTMMPVRTLAPVTHCLPATDLSHPIMVFHYCTFDKPLLVRSREPAYQRPCELCPEGDGILHSPENPYYIVNTAYMHGTRYRDGLQSDS